MAAGRTAPRAAWAASIVAWAGAGWAAARRSRGRPPARRHDEDRPVEVDADRRRVHLPVLVNGAFAVVVVADHLISPPWSAALRRIGRRFGPIGRVNDELRNPAPIGGRGPAEHPLQRVVL